MEASPSVLVPHESTSASAWSVCLSPSRFSFSCLSPTRQSSCRNAPANTEPSLNQGVPDAQRDDEKAAIADHQVCAYQSGERAIETRGGQPVQPLLQSTFCDLPVRLPHDRHQDTTLIGITDRRVCEPTPTSRRVETEPRRSWRNGWRRWWGESARAVPKLCETRQLRMRAEEVKRHWRTVIPARFHRLHEARLPKERSLAIGEADGTAVVQSIGCAE